MYDLFTLPFVFLGKLDTSILNEWDHIEKNLESLNITQVEHHKGHLPMSGHCLRGDGVVGGEADYNFPVKLTAAPFTGEDALFWKGTHKDTEMLHRWDIVQAHRSIILGPLTDQDLKDSQTGLQQCSHPFGNKIVNFQVPLENKFPVLSGNLHVRLGMTRVDFPHLVFFADGDLFKHVTLWRWHASQENSE